MNIKYTRAVCFPIGVPKSTYSANKLQIYKRKFLQNCNGNNVALQRY